MLSDGDLSDSHLIVTEEFSTDMWVTADNIPYGEYEVPLIDLDETVWTIVPFESEFEAISGKGSYIALRDYIPSLPRDDEGNLRYPSAVTVSAMFTDNKYIGIAEPVTITIE